MSDCKQHNWGAYGDCMLCDEDIYSHSLRLEQELEAAKPASEWVSVEDRLPAYGEPVKIFMNGVIQSITYCLDGFPDGGVMDWFEPYHFDQDKDELSFFYDKAESWIYVSALPTPPQTKEG